MLANLMGNVKEVTGDLPGDKGTKTEGNVDQEQGRLKETRGDIKDASTSMRCPYRNVDTFISRRYLQGFRSCSDG